MKALPVSGTETLQIANSYSGLLLRLIWQTLRADRLGSGLGRERYHKRFQETILEALEENIPLQNEFGESVSIHETEISAFGLEKFLRSSPPTRRTKIVILTHLYCQIAFPEACFIDRRHSFISQLAKKIRVKHTETFKYSDPNLVAEVMLILEGDVVIGDQIGRFNRVGHFRSVPDIDGVLFGHTHRWHHLSPSLGSLIPEAASIYNYNADVARGRLVSRKTEMIFLFSNYIAYREYRSKRPPQKYNDLTIAEPDAIPPTGIPLVGVSYIADLETGECTMNDIYTLCYDPRVGAIRQRDEEGGYVYYEKAVLEKRDYLNANIMLGRPQVSHDHQTHGYIDWKKPKFHIEQLKNIFDIYGWSTVQ